MTAFTCRSLAPLGGSGTDHPYTPQSLSTGEDLEATVYAELSSSSRTATELEGFINIIF